MKSALLGLLAGTLLVSGCSTHSVTREPAPGEGGSLSVALAKGGDSSRLKSGYTFQIGDRPYKGALFASRSDGPTTVENLIPGKYHVLVAGPKIDPETVEVHVSPGERTVVVFDLRNLKRSEVAGTAALVVGKVFLYTIFVVGYVAGWLILGCLESWIDGDDDDDDFPCFKCGRDRCSCPR